MEESYNEYKLNYNKQSVEEILIQRAVQTTIQILCDTSLFDDFQIAGESLKDFLIATSRQVDLEEVRDVVQ